MLLEDLQTQFKLLQENILLNSQTLAEKEKLLFDKEERLMVSGVVVCFCLNGKCLLLTICHGLCLCVGVQTYQQRIRDKQKVIEKLSDHLVELEPNVTKRQELLKGVGDDDLIGEDINTLFDDMPAVDE